MAKSILILGAGASATCGGPLVRDFLQRARLIYQRDSQPQEKDHFARTFRLLDALQMASSKGRIDLHNFEDVFGAIELLAEFEAELDVKGLDKDDIRMGAKSLTRVIAATLQNEIRMPIKSDGRPYNTHGTFWLHNLFSHLIAKNLANSDFCIMTFNYDLIVDSQLSHAGLAYTYSLEADDDNTKIPYLKLHGSLNWYKRDAGVVAKDVKKMEVDHPQGRPTGRRWHVLRAEEDGPVIVPPSWSKLPHHAAIRPVWKRALQELAKAEVIAVVGYSLPETDQFFRMLYSLGTIGPASFRRFAIFNPDPAVEVRFRNLAGPYVQPVMEFHEVYCHHDPCQSKLAGILFPDP